MNFMPPTSDLTIRIQSKFKPSWQKKVGGQLDRVRMLKGKTGLVLGEYFGPTFQSYSRSAAVQP